MNDKQQTEWIAEPLVKLAEFRKLQTKLMKAPIKKWLSWVLKQRPTHFTRLMRERDLTTEDLVSHLKELHLEGVRFCIVINPHKKTSRSPMMFIRGTDRKPFSNCSRCPYNKDCIVRTRLKEKKS